MPSITWHLTDDCTEQGKHWDVYDKNNKKGFKNIEYFRQTKTINSNIMDNAFW